MFYCWTVPTKPLLMDFEFSRASCYQCYKQSWKQLGNSSYLCKVISTCLELGRAVWSWTSCICEIIKVSCSSPLRDKYLCHNPLKFAFPNFERKISPQHALVLSNSIRRCEHRKLYLLTLTCCGILQKLRGWLTEASSVDESTVVGFGLVIMMVMVCENDD